MKKIITHFKTNSYRRLSICIAGLVIAATSVLQAWALDPNVPPSVNFDLSTWKLTPPDQIEIPVEDLVDYEDPNNWFYTDPVTGAMVFVCPNDGATGGSTYPRSELREMLRGTDTSISTKGINSNNWVFSTATQVNQDASGGVDGTLTATVAVDHVSETGEDRKIGRVIIGQIHASGDEPCRLYYRKLPGNSKGCIYIAHEPTDATGLDEEWYDMIGSSDNDASNPSDGIELGEQFSYEIKVVGADLTVTIMRPGKPDVVQPVDMSATGHLNDWMYFKAGCYNQNNGGDAGEYAQVSFFALNISHPVAGQSDLTVASSYGTPTPAVGTVSYDNNTVINASMSGSPDISGTTQQVVTGWTGTGDVVAGSGSSTAVTLTQNSTLTWQWQTQYWFDTSVSGSGSIDVADAWFDSGTNVTITASPAVDYHFVSWSGDSTSTNSVLNLTLDAAKSVIANFASDGPAPTLVQFNVDVVTASSYDTVNEAIPENTLDGSTNTRWSAQGDGEWIQYDLGVTQQIHAVKLAWYKGNERSSYYDVLVSLDGTNWTTVAANQTSSGLTLDLEIDDIPDTSGRYVRLVGHGNSGGSTWISLTEVEIWGLAELPTDVSIPVPEFVGGGMQFVVPSSVEGLSYQLEYTDALTPAAWGDLGSPAVGEGGDLILTDPGPLVTNRFYRIFIQH